MNMILRQNESAPENDISDEATSIGDLIKSTRERRGMSLKDVAKKTKIHVGILNQIENNNLTNLPSKPYVKGFVRSTSLFLGIDPIKALVLLEEAYDHLIFENLDLIALPPLSKQENILLKNSVLKKPRGTYKSNLPKISLQKFLFFAVVAGISAMGLISYIDTTINSNKYLIQNKTPSVETKVIAQANPKDETVAVPKDANAPAESNQGKLPMTTSLVFPKYLETRNNEGLMMPTNRF
ncbi:MAG: helix-turn-helix domain-containing protein [Bacteriovorax sp.]|nr:helix-turn-helix domain-containing protein [Bacteriovorax sp.]